MRVLDLRDYITYHPQTIEATETVLFAENKMLMEGYRHLPVTDKGRFIGVISDRDIKFASYLTGKNHDKIMIKDIIYGSDVYCIHVNTPIDVVITEMLKSKHEAAIVLEKGNIIGIFTTIDAMKALKDAIDDLKTKNVN